MARAVENSVRCRTGCTSEELHSHLAWVTTEQSLILLTLVPCEDKTWVFKYNRPPSKQPEPEVIKAMWITDWEVVNFYRTPGCWPMVGLFLEWYDNSPLSPSTNPVTLKQSEKPQKVGWQIVLRWNRKICLRKNLQLISITPSYSIPESILF